jgi:transposase
MEKRIIFATENKNAESFKHISDSLYSQNGHSNAITQVTIDMSPTSQKGARENLGNAEIVFDKIHAVAMVNDAVDKARKAQTNQGDNDFKKELKASLLTFRKSPSNLTQSPT